MGGQRVWGIVLCGTLGAACAHDWSAAADDAGIGEADVVVEATDGNAGEDAAVEDARAEAADDVEADETDRPDDGRSDAPGLCGNGLLDSSEVCDDGNNTTEWCGGETESACLSDCSLRLGTCGNGLLDPGEACDDGNADSLDDCTTSCTVNDHGIGAPCRCVAGCSDLDPSAGTFEGCEGVPPPADGIARTVCYRSWHAPPEFGFSWEIRAAEGYCTWMAVSCDGWGYVCEAVPQFGDPDTFDCPPGDVRRSATVVAPDATISVLYCARPCSSQRDCRWNAVEDDQSPWVGQCGQWTCMLSGGSGPSFCDDPRNWG